MFFKLCRAPIFVSSAPIGCARLTPSMRFLYMNMEPRKKPPFCRTFVIPCQWASLPKITCLRTWRCFLMERSWRCKRPAKEKSSAVFTAIWKKSSARANIQCVITAINLESNAIISSTSGSREAENGPVKVISTLMILKWNLRILKIPTTSHRRRKWGRSRCLWALIWPARLHQCRLTSSCLA